MRTPPPDVVKTLQRYDSDLGLRWDQYRSRWVFTYRGTDLMVWQHRNGTPAMADLPADEALSLVMEADNRRDGGGRLRRLQRRVERRREREHAEQQTAMAEASDEAEDRARVWAEGPKPFVTGQA